MNKSIGNALRQTGETSSTKDGMDIALCALSSNNKGVRLQYSGAYSPLYLIRNKKCIKTKADRFPIGNISKKQKKFTNHEFELQKGDIFYIFTDGYADQFGGPKDQKFKYKQFRDLLLSIHHLPMEEQRSILDKTISEWMKDDKIEQTDDILVIGVRV